MKASTFIRKFFQTEMLGLGFGVPVACAYVLLLISLGEGMVGKILFFVAIVAAVVVIVIAMPVNFLLSRSVKKGIDSLAKGTLTPEQAGPFFLKTMQLPLIHGILLFSRITGGILVVVGYMYFGLGVELIKCLIAIVLAGYGSYLAALVVYMAAVNLVRPVGREVLAKGLLKADIIEKKRIFGMGVITRNILFLVVPVVLTNATLFLAVFEGLISGISLTALLPKAGGVAAVNTFTLLISIFLTLAMTRKPVGALMESLKVFSGRGSKGFGDPVPTDLLDEFAYIGYLMNRAIDSFKNILGEIRNAASLIAGAVQDLSVTSQEISATSNEQAAAVKEIVSTMEDSDQVSKSIATRVHEVSRIAGKTKETVENGMLLVKDSLAKMREIRASNGQTLTGIRSLGEKIESIWDIVNIINGIADQTKIIAFNAELEASAAGDAGRNFQIVAAEIRRLADSTVASTSEIKTKINEMQHSSDNLIIASEEGTGKIKEGSELSSKLNEVFGDIMSSADISAGSATRIEESVNQQVSAFGQILVTLKQISEGINNFVSSTKSTSSSSEKLREMSETLNGLVRQYLS